MKKYGRILLSAIVAAGIFAAASGMTNAYLVRETQTLHNIITPGGISIALTEPAWDPESAQDLVPRQIIAKDPVVTNNGQNAAWVFLRVAVPVRTVATVDPQTKKKEPKADTELFAFDAQAGWELVDSSTDAAAVHYVYGYQKLLSPGESTGALFTEVTFANVLEGEIDGTEPLEIPVEAVAIQENVAAEGGIYAVYAEYLRQEAADEKGEG